MKLIVGLGNPGSKYRGTRHNIGFEIVDELARRRNLVFESSPAEAVMARERGPDARMMLVKPLTYMNLSGVAVGTLARYFRVGFEDVLVVTDDVNLTLGRVRARPSGSDGGHNGLRSVIELLGTDQEVADVEWTFPLEFAEVVWGDGETTDRQIVPATDLPPFGRHRFEIPFDATGKKWVRFAVWDSAGNGALVQPIKLVDRTN